VAVALQVAESEERAPAFKRGAKVAYEGER
jgi:hypothetical protein